MPAAPDRLRDLLDLVVGSLDEPGADGRALAARAHFSRDHLDRLLSGATGESPVALRRRLLLERAAWELRARGATPTEVAARAGYRSPAAFSRAFVKAYGVVPSAFADAAHVAVSLPAPNGVRFHPPGAVAFDARGGDGGGGARASGGNDGLVERLVGHHLDRARQLLERAATLPAEALARPLRPGFVAHPLEGEEPSAELMAERLVATLEVWNAAIGGEVRDGPASGTRVERLDRAGRVFAATVRALRDRGAWDAGFVDALCEPPRSFTYGSVVAHVIEYGAIRREMLASVLAELGAGDAEAAEGDPIAWELERGHAIRRPRR
ncbi:MAG TPA: AraC family transcriptional regulator [Baekduia sp.]|nr:AraC family transcriptional regulator [Baekduia sp.]